MVPYQPGTVLGRLRTATTPTGRRDLLPSYSLPHASPIIRSLKRRAAHLDGDTINSQGVFSTTAAYICAGGLVQAHVGAQALEDLAHAKTTERAQADHPKFEACCIPPRLEIWSYNTRKMK